jgi:hypothetical protein
MVFGAPGRVPCATPTPPGGLVSVTSAADCRPLTARSTVGVVAVNGWTGRATLTSRGVQRVSRTFTGI